MVSGFSDVPGPGQLSTSLLAHVLPFQLCIDDLEIGFWRGRHEQEGSTGCLPSESKIGSPDKLLALISQSFF